MTKSISESKQTLLQYDYFELYELQEQCGSQRKLAEHLDVPRTTLQEYYNGLQEKIFSHREPIKAIRIDPDPVDTKRFLLTSAQDETEVHKPFFANLKAYRDFLEGRIFIGTFTYNKRLFEDNRPNHAHYVKEVRGDMTRDRIEIGPNLVFCGEMNTLPTAVSPLSGFESYTQNKSGIFPHAKMQWQSIGTQKGFRPKTLVTTGACTRPNYVTKRAGIKAEFHHIIGAIIVELLPDGDFFMRQISAEPDGSFEDAGIRVENGMITFNHEVEAITHGDIHYENMDYTTAGLVWFNEKGTLVDVLRPKYQFFHDTLDFDNRGHHRIADPHHQYKMFIQGCDSIEQNMKGIGEFLYETTRPWSKSVIVESNHDLHFLRWLKTADFRLDPANAELYLQSQLECYHAIREGDERFSAYESTLRRLTPKLEDRDILFLREDDSFVICATPTRAGIENGLHGHLGVNGSRGSVKSFTKIGPRTNTAHTHAPTAYDGAYCAGTYSKLDLVYNHGPSSWAPACVITYKSGKRSICQFTQGMWRAPLD